MLAMCTNDDPVAVESAYALLSTASLEQLRRVFLTQPEWEMTRLRVPLIDRILEARRQGNPAADRPR